MRWSLQRIGGSPQICNMTVLVRLLWSMRTLHDNILMIFRLQIARTVVPDIHILHPFRVNRVPVVIHPFVVVILQYVFLGIQELLGRKDVVIL